MTAIISLLVWASFVVSSINTISGYDPDLSYPENINDTIAIAVDKNDIEIHFYNNDTVANDTIVDITDQEAVQNTTFSNTKQTFFIIHGWRSDSSDDICTTIRDAHLQSNDVNVFVVDWSGISEQLYVSAYAAVEPLGKLLATMIQELVSNNGLDLAKTALVGHSLGAHMAGVTGTALEGACDYIVGLDPAGPLFVYDSINNRIAPSSAQFVQIIHTCGSELGFYKPLGLADYYPNGGMRQSGCGVDLTGMCSHSRSYIYYVESILSGNFVAQRCESYDDYQEGTCNGSFSLMGGYDIDKSARGSFYLDTNEESPFAKGEGTSFS